MLKFFVSLWFFLAVFTIFFFSFIAKHEKFAKRIERATGTYSRIIDHNALDPVYRRIIIGIGFFIARSGIISKNSLQKLSHTLVISGIKDKKSLGMFIGTKILFFFFFPFLTIVFYSDILNIHRYNVLIFSFSAVAGLLLPDFWVNAKRKTFIRRLEAGLADTLDMMVICADAGLSLEATLARVADEIRGAHHAVAEELLITGHEMRIGTDVREALVSLGTRTGLASLKRLGSTLIQTIQYGTPLTQALRILSIELRQEQLTRFEERAARLPVLLTVPMILFILPCVFLVVGGPAILKVMAAFTNR